MRLFISYAHDNLNKVEKLVEALREGKHTPLYDTDLKIGQNWQERLRQMIIEADALVYALTPESIASEWCQWEFVTAVELGKPVIPIMLETSKLPVVLNQYHYFDMTGNITQRKKDVLNSQLKHYEVVIDPAEAPVKPVHPQGEPALVSLINMQNVDQSISVGNISNSRVSITGGSITNIVNKRTWVYFLIILILILMSVVLILLFVPENQRPDLPNRILIAVGLQEPTLEPPDITHDLGIGVAYFDIADNALSNKSEVDKMSRQIYSRLEGELTEFATESDLDIGLFSPSTIGRVEGSDSVERENHAQNIARKYNLDIVLYGVVLQDGLFVEVQPEFYVNPAGFRDALEMTGAFRLGQELDIETPIDGSNVLNVNQSLSTRTAAAAHIFRGLTYYWLEDYQTAFDAFQLALDLPDWNETEGKEVLYVLMGNAHVKMGGLATQALDYDNALSLLDVAESYYQQGLNLDPEYSRLHTGIASALYLKTTTTIFARGESNIEWLRQALDHLDQAATAPPSKKPDDVGIEARELWVRAQIDYVLLWRHTDELGQIETQEVERDFIELTNEIIGLYDEGRNPSVQELASEAAAFRGLRSIGNADDPGQCEPDLRYALETAISPRRSMYFHGWLGDCYTDLEFYRNAEEQYEMALEIANRLDGVSDALKQSYQDKITDVRRS